MAWASSCTSSHGIPITLTRYASTVRCRATIRSATSWPRSVKWISLWSSRLTRPSSTSRFSISDADGWETRSARARLAWVRSMPAS